jgi:serine/threonine protein kinase
MAPGTPVAIKSLKASSSDERKLLLNEVRTLIEVEGCPYLVQWHAGFASKSTGQVHLVLELMDRGSLASLHIPSREMPPRMLAAISLQVLRGIEHLHARRLLHNDIKPGNILLNQFGDVKVTDFGITTSMDISLCDTCRGTQTYFAPEKVMASSGAGYSFPADIWSFGVVCYELMTGVHPLAEASSIPDIFCLLLESPEPRLAETDGFPAALCDFVARCLTRDPDRRATAQELLAHNFITDAGSQEELSTWLVSFG